MDEVHTVEQINDPGSTTVAVTSDAETAKEWRDILQEEADREGKPYDFRAYSIGIDEPPPVVADRLARSDDGGDDVL